VTKSIRTYTSLEGMDMVPPLAAKYGFTVTQSAWLGRDLIANDKNIQALIAVANAYPATIKRVIVGNEVLLRRDLTPAELIVYIRRVRAAVRQPVSYADVWAFWLKHPELAKEVDFITIHILPYWEDEPVSIDAAIRHVETVYRRVQRAFPGKPILIGEAGWPTRGRERGPAIPSVANAARFVRALALAARKDGFDYNIVEAFDQPWKAQLEGTVGANWGIFTDSGRAKYGMSGPVRENPGWPYQGAAAAMIGAVGAYWILRRRAFCPARAASIAVLAQVLAISATWQAINAWWLAYDWGGIAWAMVRIGLHATLAGLILWTAGRQLAIGAKSLTVRWAERLSLMYGVAAILDTVLLLINGRYRDIPNLEFLVPCVGLTLFALFRMVILGFRWEEAFAIGRLFSFGEPGRFAAASMMTVGLWAAAAMAPLSEAVALAQGQDFIAQHPDFHQQLPLLLRSLTDNREMLIWSAMLVVLSIPYGAEWRRARRDRSGQRLPASNPATS
jgi:exo-beta-1,3-glucanase (GH17 family)